jgi:hypothetical protein
MITDPSRLAIEKAWATQDSETTLIQFILSCVQEALMNPHLGEQDIIARAGVRMGLFGFEDLNPTAHPNLPIVSALPAALQGS